MIYSFPDFLSKIEKILSSFDVEKALDQGLIIPNEGYFEEYDISNQQVEEKLDRLQEYLAEQRKHFPGIPIEYSSGQSKFDLEITNIKESTKLPHDYILVSQTKNLKRFTTQELKKLKFELDKAKQLKEETLQNSTKLIFTQFMSNKSEWEASVDLLGEIDALFSLAKYSRGDRYSNIINMCQPKFHSPNEKTERSDNYIQIFNSFHPQMICSNTNVVPNNIFLNCNDFSKPLLLLTGPNMGGKSTLMRQTAQLVILSQIGCYLPAEKMNIGLPIDRIFVRIGANDSLITGQSTFMTEMSETSIILQHSTRNSLVIIDELGRGTSTFDGVSIAMSVAKELSQNISCMTLFSTHYHDLVFNMSNCEAKIAYGHMNCITTGQADCGESDNKLIDKQNNSMLQDIVFLYKLVQGVCPKSYGFNAAKIAGIPEEVFISF
ncbi:MAG: DNA mismatch repair protein msh6, variant 3 [Marteilia pararefringens]